MDAVLHRRRRARSAAPVSACMYRISVHGGDRYAGRRGLVSEFTFGDNSVSMGGAPVYAPPLCVLLFVMCMWNLTVHEPAF
jgi:hypothetical protein